MDNERYMNHCTFNGPFCPEIASFNRYFTSHPTPVHLIPTAILVLWENAKEGQVNERDQPVLCHLFTKEKYFAGNKVNKGQVSVRREAPLPNFGLLLYFSFFHLLCVWGESTETGQTGKGVLVGNEKVILVTKATVFSRRGDRATLVIVFSFLSSFVLRKSLFSQFLHLEIWRIANRVLSLSSPSA